MSPIRPYEKKKYHKKSTIDLSKLKPVVNPELKKRNDELFETLVDNLNRNTTKKREPIVSKPEEEQMKYIPLILILLSPFAFAETEDIGEELKEKITLINSSAKSFSGASSYFQFGISNSLRAKTQTHGSDGGQVYWDGVYELRTDKPTNGTAYLRMYSDENQCDYVISRLGSFYKFINIKRNFTNICPDLLMKQISSIEL